MSSQEKIEEIKNQIDENLESAPTVESIPLEFVAGSQKLKSLIESDDERIEKLRKGDYKLSINRTFLVRNIQIKTESTLKEFQSYFEINVCDINGNWTQAKATSKSKSGNILIPVNKVVRNIEIVSKGKISLNKRPSINHIFIYGYRERDFEKIALYATDLFDLRNSLTELAEEIEEKISQAKLDIQTLSEEKLKLENTIEELESDRSENQEELDQTTAELNSVKEELTDAEEKVSSLANKLSNIENSIDEKSDERSKLISETNDLKQELRRLTEDKNTFSSELTDYIEEGEKNIRKYYWLASIPVLIMATLTIILVNNSINLFQYNSSLEEVLGTILSRTPFTLATIGLITASYKICKYFISEMTKIYNERLSMTKLSIIAKEVSNSVFDEESDPEIKYALRAQLKMDLLKHYMKNEIGDSFKLTKKENEQATKDAGDEKASDEASPESRSDLI